MRARQLFLLLGVVAFVVLGRTVRAEPTAAEVQAARRLFEQATRDEEAGHWQDALVKLRNVEQIKMTPGVLFHIAVCEQNLGRYVEALNDLGRSEELARARDDKSVLDLVPERRSQLEAKVTALRVVITGDTQGSEVRVDDQQISPAALQLDIPLDPGEHRITVRRPPAPELLRKVTLDPGQRRVEEFALALAPEPAPPTRLTPISESQSPEFKSYLAKHIVIYSSYALALVGVGAGTFLLLDASEHDSSARYARAQVTDVVQSLDDQRIVLPNPPCSVPYQASSLQGPCVRLKGSVKHRDDSERLALISFAVAGVGAIAGTAAVLFWPEPRENEAAVRIAPTLGGIQAFGAF